MVLGTVHFASPGLDEVNPKFDDPLSDRRQREIEAVLAMLMPFRPPTVALEFPFHLEETLNEFYSQFIAGLWDTSAGEPMESLERSETFQLGFRLAKSLSLRTVYASVK